VPRPDTGTKTKLGPGTAVDLTGGTNSTEERKTGKKATQYSPRTTQKKQPLQLNCTEPQQDKSAADNTGRELRTHAQTKNQKPNLRSSNTKKRSRETIFQFKLKKDYT
jgi:predicted GIY-YIG superfamily endonuclease